MSIQTVFNREEIKFLISKEKKDIILESLEGLFVPDDYGESTIYSLYLDTPDFLLARRSLEKPLYKEKLRLRSYGRANDNTLTFFEIKKKFRTTTTKRRISLPYPELIKLLEEGESYSPEGISTTLNPQVLHEINYSMKRYHDLKPRVLMTYDRQAYYHKDDHDFRITFDRNIRFKTADISLNSAADGESILQDDYYIMEVKILNAMPLWFARLLSENQIYKTSYSKYREAYTRITEQEKTLCQTYSQISSQAPLLPISS